MTEDLTIIIPKKIHFLQESAAPKNISDNDRVLTRAVELVALIRAEHGNYFTIAVAGHPHVHPDSLRRHGGNAVKAMTEALQHLKAKVYTCIL